MKINNFVIIIGAMKCGTSSLFNYLAQHPQISACSRKEPNFFCTTHNFDRGFEFYQNLWDWDNNQHKIALEATTNYTKFTNYNYMNAAENIAQIQKSTNANFKFIYIMRNPLDRIESHYTHSLVLKKGTDTFTKPLHKKIDDETINTSSYAMQIEQYYKRFTPDDILLLNFEDLKNQPLKVVKEVCLFLNIDSNYEFKGLNAIHNVHNIKIGLPGWYSMKKNKLIQSTIRLLPPDNRETLRSIFGVKRNDYIKLSPEQRKYALDMLKNDLQKLSSEYGFDISRWSF